jgi:hypothetical protein
MADGAAEVSDRACGRAALVPHGLWAWPSRPDTTMPWQRPCLGSGRALAAAVPWQRPWPAEVAVPDPCPAAPSPCPRRLPQGLLGVRAGGRRAIGRRTPAVRTVVVPKAADGQSAADGPRRRAGGRCDAGAATGWRGTTATGSAARSWRFPGSGGGQPGTRTPAHRPALYPSREGLAYSPRHASRASQL